MTRQYRCHCSDTTCPTCSGKCTQPYDVLLYRIDFLRDEAINVTGERFCEVCAEHALDTGFTTEPQECI